MQRTSIRFGILTTTLTLARAALAGDPAPAAPGAADAATLSGKVIETMDASRYTYVCIDTGARKVWAAGPTCAVKTGEVVTIDGGMRMTDFVSKALSRTFPELYFVDRIRTGTAGPKADAGTPAKLPPGHPPLPPAAGGAPTNLPAGHPAIGLSSKNAATAMRFDDIRKPDGGRTVAEVWAGRKELAGQTVLVRGKVVKAVTDVMDRNWLHLRDGTGGEGSNDLTVTTKATAAVGDTVTVKGVLAVDRDFGAGYRYAVIVEDATLVAP